MQAEHQKVAQQDEPIRVVYCTDTEYAWPTAVSLYSVLRLLSGRSEIFVFLSRDVSDAQIRCFAEVCRLFPEARLTIQEIQSVAAQFLGPGKQGLQTCVTLYRLCLPRLLDGKVIYLDGDTIALKDMRILWTLPLSGGFAAATRNYGFICDVERVRANRRLGRYDPKIEALEEELRLLCRTLRLDNIADYINAGVLLLDLDAIRKQQPVLDALTDLGRAAGYTRLDQDWLFLCLRSGLVYLDPAWNTYWGNSGAKAWFMSAGMRKFLYPSHVAPRLVHYAGAHKPWACALEEVREEDRRWFLFYRWLEHGLRLRLPPALPDPAGR
jgi:lipopolysaccharide biosynthesis glycosyltransferase